MIVLPNWLNEGWFNEEWLNEEWLNEAGLRTMAVVLGLALRLVRGVFFGFRDDAVGTDGDMPLSSIISGLIVAAVLLALLWTGARELRGFRMNSPGAVAVWAGAVLLWLGCAIGLYFWGLTFHVLALPDRPSKIVGCLVGTAGLHPAAGRGIRFMLGH